MPKSTILPEETMKVDPLGRSYYCFCLEKALNSIKQARALVSGDIIETNHELARIELLISAALGAS